jgi:CRISPR/Cas system CSM-associated protein Csm3 (group 7 of RAMP superfamily)
MNRMLFEVEFLTDIVLPATSNTEGKVEKLDFIPGSNFLGIVASDKKYGYSSFKNPFEIFHSGKVRFGDASLLWNSKKTYKIPFSFFHEKLDKSVVYNHHLIEDFSKFKQLKQMREGYITDDVEFLEVEYNYTQKSAYDRGKRRSKDSSMYGYEAIKRGTKWSFEVEYDKSISSDDIKMIKESLSGEKKLGKSKKSQYGRVNIKYIDTLEEEKSSDEALKEVILYAKSRLILFDDSAKPTFDLKYLCKGLTDENIEHKKTQIRVGTYIPYNSAMKTKVDERAYIKSGSVIVLKNITKEQLEVLKSGVGAYLSEGFGKVLINPHFLKQESFKYVKIDKKSDATSKDSKKKEYKDVTMNFLLNRKDKKEKMIDLVNSVMEFIDNEKATYKNIKPSQWGNIRAICNSFEEDKMQKITKYISHGEKKWSKTQREKIENKSLEFLKLLSIQMPKAQKEAR